MNLNLTFNRTNQITEMCSSIMFLHDELCSSSYAAVYVRVIEIVSVIHIHLLIHSFTCECVLVTAN